MLLAAAPFVLQFSAQRIEAAAQLAGIDQGEAMLFAYAVQQPLQFVGGCTASTATPQQHQRDQGRQQQDHCQDHEDFDIHATSLAPLR